jgi:hypothetical protein
VFCIRILNILYAQRGTVLQRLAAHREPVTRLAVGWGGDGPLCFSLDAAGTLVRWAFDPAADGFAAAGDARVDGPGGGALLVYPRTELAAGGGAGVPAAAALAVVSRRGFCLYDPRTLERVCRDARAETRARALAQMRTRTRGIPSVSPRDAGRPWACRRVRRRSLCVSARLLARVGRRVGA